MNNNLNSDRIQIILNIEIVQKMIVLKNMKNTYIELFELILSLIYYYISFVKNYMLFLKPYYY
jgi:hypothetical protein